MSRTFEIVSPGREGLEDGQELFVVSVVIEFGRGESPGVERDRMNFDVRSNHGEDCGDRIVRGVGLDDKREGRIEMMENRGRGEVFLERLERLSAYRGEIPFLRLSGESGKRDNDVRVSVDKASVKVREAEKGLNVANVPGFGPIEDSLDLVFGHGNAVSGNDETEEFDRFRVELALLGLAEEIVFPETPEDFFDVFLVVIGIVGVDEDVIEVNDDVEVEDVGEDVVHEALEGRRCVR
jgi:hypothetical protein